MPPSARPGMATTERLRNECERIASACSACGACVRACPMLVYAPVAAAADPGDVVRGVIDLLRGGPSTPPALAWTAACTRSAVCSDACQEEAIDPAYMMRLAKMRAMGALSEPPTIPVKDDTQFSARVKAFARLTLTQDEQEKWL